MMRDGFQVIDWYCTSQIVVVLPPMSSLGQYAGMSTMKRYTNVCNRPKL